MGQKIAGSNRKRDIDDLEAFIGDNPILAESYAAAAGALLSMRAEDVGWGPINRMNEDDGFTLDALKDIAEHADLQTTGNPLLKRGLTLRASNVFGRGMIILPEATQAVGDAKPVAKPIAPRYQAIIDKPINQNTLFTSDAYTRNERELFTAGNLFLLYDNTEKTWQAIPFKEITNSASNPRVTSDVWFYQHTFTEIDIKTGKPELEPTVVWYPTLERSETPKAREQKFIGEGEAAQKIDWNFSVVDVKVNTSVGSVWGVPDCLPAMPYAWAHAEYIRDASKLLKALATIAWKVVARSKGNAATAGMKLAGSNRTASTAAMTTDTDLVAMPKSGQVNMRDGLAIAGYVASALEVSLIALTSDPGSASGSYGAAATLDGPTANSARARQQLWQSVYRRIYRAMGVQKITVNFPKIAEDPAYRVAQTLTMGFAGGAFHQDEYRAAMLEATDVVSLHDDVPDATVFTIAAKFSAEAMQQAEEEAQLSAQSAVNGQGQANGIGSSAGNNDLRDSDATPGTGS